jgi:hypothetical protein
MSSIMQPIVPRAREGEIRRSGGSGPRVHVASGADPGYLLPIDVFCANHAG